MGLDSGDDAPQGRECDRSSKHIEGIKGSTGLRFEARKTYILGWSSHSAGYNHEESHQGPLAADVVY